MTLPPGSGRAETERDACLALAERTALQPRRDAGERGGGEGRVLEWPWCIRLGPSQWQHRESGGAGAHREPGEPTGIVPQAWTLAAATQTRRVALAATAGRTRW